MIDIGGLESVFKLSVVLGVVDNLSGKLSGINNQVNSSLGEMNSTFSKMKSVGTTMSAIGTAVTGAALSTVTATFSTQDALGELKSLGVKDLAAVENAARDFSNTWAGTTKSDFISASYDIKSGIASLSDEGVAKFTELSGLTAKATKASTADMTSLFATGYGIYKDYYGKMSDMEFGEMFSAGISTAVKNYKTSGTGMADAIKTIGATATNAKVPMEEQLAILGQLQATMSGSEAGTKYKAFLNGAAGAGEKLKLSFLDANNNLLSTPEILAKLKGKYGETIDAVEKQQLKEAFGTDEAIAMIDLLYGKTGTLKSGMDDLASSMKKGTAVTKGMADAIQNTPAQKFQTIKQQIHNNVEELGNGLLPAFNQTADKVSGLIKKTSDWVVSNQTTVHTIMRIVLFLGIFVTVLGGLIASVSKAVKMFKLVKTAITAMNAVFMSSPVGWITLGIVALIAAFVLLYKNCEQFRTFWNNTFNGVKTVFNTAWNGIRPQIKIIGESLKQLGISILPLIKVIGAGIGSVLLPTFGVLVGILRGVASAIKPILRAFNNLVQYATNVVKVIGALFRGDFTGACDFACAEVDNLQSFFINAFDAVTSFITGYINGFLDTISNALKAVGIDASGTIAKMKSAVSTGMNAIRGAFSKGITAAGNTVKSTLNNMKSAYKSHGGGVKGIVAATMQGIKGRYTAGFAVVDSITGGKLSAIKSKVASKFSSITSTIGDKMNTAKEKVKAAIDKIKGFFNFDWSLPKLKMPHFSASGKFSLNPLSVPKLGVEWYKDGGIMTSPTVFGMNGNNLMVGGEAGAEAIVPLAELWSKMGQFIHQESYSDEKSEKINLSEVLSKETNKTIKSSKSSKITEKITNRKSEKTSGKIVINKLELKVDMSKIKDLSMLYRLIDELKDAQNSTDEFVTE